VQVTTELEAQKKAALKAKREKEASRASAKKSFQYKGGLTIEEHSDEDEGKGGNKRMEHPACSHDSTSHSGEHAWSENIYSTWLAQQQIRTCFLVGGGDVHPQVERSVKANSRGLQN